MITSFEIVHECLLFFFFIHSVVIVDEIGACVVALVNRCMLLVQFSDCHAAYIDVRRVYFDFSDFGVCVDDDVFECIVVHRDVEFVWCVKLHEEWQCVDVFD